MKIKTFAALCMSFSFSCVANAEWCRAVTPQHLYIDSAHITDEGMKYQYVMAFRDDRGVSSEAVIFNGEFLINNPYSEIPARAGTVADLFKTAIIAGKKIEIDGDTCVPEEGDRQTIYQLSLTNMPQ